MNCISSHFVVCIFVFHRVALLLESRFTHTVYTSVYATIKKGVWHFEMDCEWNFKSQTSNKFFAESNNQNELFSCIRTKHTGNKGTTISFLLNV